MNRRVKKSPQPRYITIRIKYYPIGKEIIAALILLIFIAFGHWVYPIFQDWKTLSERTHFYMEELPKFYQSTVLSIVLCHPREHFHPCQAGGLLASGPEARSEMGACFKKMDSWFAAKNYKTLNFPKKEVINNGSRDKRQVALTFDADMTPEMKDDLATGVSQSSYNKKIVDVLRQTQTKATIFASGMWIELYPEVTKELVADSLFEFGNHSYSHPGFDGDCWGLTPLSDEGNKDEFEKTQTLLKQYTGKENKLFRFPGGCYSQKDLEDVGKSGMYVVHWDSVGSDGFNDSVENIEENVLSSAQNGSIIVLHFNGPPNSPLTDDALPTIIGTLRKRGFEFVKVSELLDLNQKPRKNLIISDFLKNIGYNK